MPLKSVTENISCIGFMLFEKLRFKEPHVNTTINEVSVQCKATLVSDWPETVRHGLLKKLTFV